jgi:uncharacterized membrane protein YedE/YeeE
VDDFGHTGDLGGGCCGGTGVVAGHQHVHVAAAGMAAVTVLRVAPLMDGVVVFSNDENGQSLRTSGCATGADAVSDQITLASFLSLSTRVATSGTLMPALRLRARHLQGLEARGHVHAQRFGVRFPKAFSWPS